MTKSKLNYILGTVTITAIIGGTVYVIYKAKQAEKLEEDSITLEEAREIVAKQRKFDKGEETVRFQQDIEEVNESKPRHVVGPQKPKAVKYDEDMELDEGLEDLEDIYEVDGDPLYDKYERVDENTPGPTVTPLNDFMYYEDGIDNPKEDKTLRFPNSSDEARHQFIRMELADWEPTHPVYRILIQLMEIPFIPTNDGDETLRTQIIDYKVQFFGWGSKWNREVSFADVILHYARSAEFNCEETVQYWVEYFLDFNEFEWDSTTHEMDKLVGRLNTHSYFNEERQTFGLFGITREHMDQAISIAQMNLDRSVTYEIEFQEFLKSCL